MAFFEFKEQTLYAAPIYESCTPDFWKKVKVNGWAGSLSGPGRELLQAGHWDLDFPGTHYEYFEIKDVVGLELGRHKSWRRG